MLDAPVIGTVGMRGFGKTTRVREQTEFATRVVAWDPMVGPHAPRGQFNFPHRFLSGDEAAEFIRWRGKRTVRVAVHGPEPEHFDPLVEAIHDVGGDLVVLVDEAGTLFEKGKPRDSFAWLLNYSRHIDVSIRWTARRPGEVGPLCAGQSEIMESFRITSVADLDALRPAFGPEAIKRIPTLERLHFLSTED